MIFISSNKKYLFLDSISNKRNIAWFFFLILFNQFHVYIYFYYHLIK